MEVFPIKPLKELFANPIYFPGLRSLPTLPPLVWTVDADLTHYPDADFTTIQAAIDAASAGDTILVFPGIYKEALLIDKALTLYGNGAYIHPLATGRIGGKATISNLYPVSITASQVSFLGFELIEFNYGIHVPASAFLEPEYALSNITLSYNWLHSDVAWVGTTVAGGNLSYYEVSHSIIDVYQDPAGTNPYALTCIGFSEHGTIPAHYDHITVRSNVLRNRSKHYDLFAGANPSTYTIEHCVIECNHFLNDSTSTVVDGASFNIGNIMDGRFENNVVEHTPGSIGIQNGLIRGNSFLHGGYLKLWGTEYGFTRPSKNVIISNNEFSNEVFGNGIHLRKGADAATISNRLNSFADSGIGPNSMLDPSIGYAIRNDTNLIHDATHNWWSSSDGPSTISGRMYGPVLTTPCITRFTLDDKSGRRLCWPLSTFRKTMPGFYPRVITAISFVGDSCFEPDECVQLAALVAFCGGNGKDIPVEFTICGCTHRTRTVAGGYACVKVGRLCLGAYAVTASTGEHSVTTTIHISCACEVPLSAD